MDNRAELVFWVFQRNP